MITVPEEKGPSFNFITQMFKEIGHILQRKKITTGRQDHYNI